MDYYVYALKSEKDDHLYIGMSSHPEKRLEEHNRGMVTSTRARKPFRLIYIEKLPSRIEARKREKQLKSGSGREFIKRNIFSLA